MAAASERGGFFVLEPGEGGDIAELTRIG